MDIKKEIDSGLKAGKSKFELYNEYKEIVEDDLLRKILASRPSHDIGITYKVLHKIICCVWLLFFVMEFVGAMDVFIHGDIKVLISLTISGYLLVQLWKFNGDAYLPGIFWLAWALLNTYREIRKFSNEVMDDETIFISDFFILVLLITIIVMSIVRKTVFGHYNWFKPAHDVNNKIVFQEEKAPRSVGSPA